ncbi:hypothetical protein ONZ45_g13306 [Pleurotus djamor]|nr:hypothetical protein ONZ45_g13306 [Pleurotus djamor]
MESDEHASPDQEFQEGRPPGASPTMGSPPSPIDDLGEGYLRALPSTSTRTPPDTVDHDLDDLDRMPVRKTRRRPVGMGDWWGEARPAALPAAARMKGHFASGPIHSIKTADAVVGPHSFNRFGHSISPSGELRHSSVPPTATPSYPPSYVDRYIRDKAMKRVRECPIRLYDVTLGCFCTRDELSEHLESQARALIGINDGPPRNELKSQEHQAIQEEMIRLSKYAILSHTWSTQESSYKDVLNQKQLRNPKFKGLCQAARDYDCRYVWIDTACIDKSSSSELVESIRSMYTWYKKAHVCFVYLSTPFGQEWQVDPWFIRGWTLQELIAPLRMVFYASRWERLFPSFNPFDVVRRNRPQLDPLRCCWDEVPPSFSAADKQTDRSTLEEIASIAGVDTSVSSSPFNGANNPNVLRATGISISDMECFIPSPSEATTIFRYMSERLTTVPEDLAYSLLGLLDISIPIIYGEGEARALYRLQIACADALGDRGLFLWDPVDNFSSPLNSMLPHNPYISKRPAVSISPDSLWDSCGKTNDSLSTVDPSFSFTNCGLRIAVTLHDISLTETTLQLRALPEMDIVVRSNQHGDVDYTHKSKLAVLGASDDDEATPFAIVLQKLGNGRVPRYRRLPVHIDAKTLPPMSILAAHPPEIVLIV